MNNMEGVQIKTEPLNDEMGETGIFKCLKDNNSETGPQSLNIPANCFHSIFEAEYPKWEMILIKTEPGLDVDDNVSNSTTKHSCPSIGYKTEYPKSKITHDFIYKAEQVFDKSSSRERLKCPCCYFLTDNRGNLTQHMKVHRRPEGVVTYVCELCRFSTKYKNSIKGHVLRHEKLKDNI